MAPRDEFDDPEGFFARLVTHTGNAAGSVFENRSLLISGAVFVVVVALSGVIWASYPSQNPLTSDGSVPIIRADAEPYKYAPADRGGMAIPHQDSTIFAAMRSDSPDGKVENLLGESDEQPMDRQQLFAGLKTDLADATGREIGHEDDVRVAGVGDYDQARPMSESERRAEAAKRNRERLMEEAAPLPDEAEVNTRRLPGVLNQGEVKPELSADEPEILDLPAATVETAPVKAPEKVATPKVDEKKAEPAPAAVVKKDEPKKVAPVKTAEAPAPKVTTGSGTAYVQVASVPDAGRVKGEWASLTSALPMLTGLDYRVQKADIAGKGTYHRIQVGPMSKDEATALCTAIKVKKPGGCLIAK